MACDRSDDERATRDLRVSGLYGASAIAARRLASALLLVVLVSVVRFRPTAGRVRSLGTVRGNSGSLRFIRLVPGEAIRPFFSARPLYVERSRFGLRSRLHSPVRWCGSCAPTLFGILFRGGAPTALAHARHRGRRVFIKVFRAVHLPADPHAAAASLTTLCHFSSTGA